MLAVYGSILVLFGALGYSSCSSRSGSELGNISEDLSNIYRTLVVRWGGGVAQNLPALSARLPRPESWDRCWPASDVSGTVQRLASVTSSVTNFLTYAGIAVVVSIYWISDRLHFERLLLSLLPATHRTRARAMWRTLEAGVGAYLRSELVQGVLAAMLLAPAFR